MKVDIRNLNPEAMLRHEIVNRAGVSKLIYPNTEYAPTKLDAKIRGSNGRRLTDNDKELLEQALLKFLNDIGIVVEDSEDTN